MESRLLLCTASFGSFIKKAWGLQANVRQSIVFNSKVGGLGCTKRGSERHQVHDKLKAIVSLK